MIYALYVCTSLSLYMYIYIYIHIHNMATLSECLLCWLHWQLMGTERGASRLSKP